MPRNLNSSLMKPFVVLAIPGMYLFYKYNQYKRQRQEQNRRKVTERELARLNHKIDKLLAKLDEHEPELASSQEEGCVICITARATMQTFPCGHRVVCRKCFVKTIQTAVAQRMLPLRCVICRAKILRIKQSTGIGISPSPSASSSLSAFSACSSSFSLKSFKTTDSVSSRASSCGSTRSAPPLLLRHSSSSSFASSILCPRSCSPSPTASCHAFATSSSSTRTRTPNSSGSSKATAANALTKVAKQQARDHGNKASAPAAEAKEGKASKEKANNGRNKIRSSHKVQSLPKATVRSRSPHKLQLHMHRLEIIKEVE